MLKHANNDDKEEYFEITYDKNHMAINISPKIMSIQNKIPT